MCPRRRRGASLFRRVPKPVDFPFEQFPERNERNGWLVDWLTGRSQSQERETRLRLRFVTPYRRRVFHACIAKSFVKKKKPRTYCKRDRGDRYISREGSEIAWSFR